MKNKKNALITGITGQDGSFLAELLLSKGYGVFGLHRRLSSSDLNCASHLINDVTFIEGDMCDRQSLLNAVKISKPHEVYNLAAQSHVGTSFTQPNFTFDVNGRGVLYLLEAIKESGINCKFYQASTSEQFGGVVGSAPQNENTPFIPKSPYAVSKLYGYETVRHYRDIYNLFACNGICFNHESERRGFNFVSRKISDGVAKIYCGIEKELTLGNLDALRDWGYAKEYVEGMWMMLQHNDPDDYVLSTGKLYSVRDMCEISFRSVGLDYRNYIITDSEFLRDNEVNVLQGDSTKAKQILGWESKTSFEDLMSMMVKFDCERHGKLNDKVYVVPDVQNEPISPSIMENSIKTSNMDNTFIKLLKPNKVYTSKGYSCLTKKRIGPQEDGGYIMADFVLENCSALFTYGVGGDDRFEVEFSTTYNKPSYLFDHDVRRVELERVEAQKLEWLAQDRYRESKNCYFFPRGLGFGENLNDFSNEYKELGIKGPVLLKIDIEGYELDYFTDPRVPSIASTVMGIILEVHSIDRDVNREKFIKIMNILNENFILIHTHGNVWAEDWVYDSMKIPQVLELSFINKKYLDRYEPDNQDYPIVGLDFSNRPEFADCDMSFLKSV